jgi:hypothetical protein
MNRGSKPVGLGRNERGERRSRSQGVLTRSESQWDQTGAFTGIGRPSLKGVSDVVAIATVKNAKAARRAERAWMRELRSQGVRF